MKRLAYPAILAALLLGPAVTAARSGESDDALIAAIIAQSRAAYPGKCGCPDDVDRAGRSCGRRSAWSRAGGASLICYPQDITPEMLARYRRALKK